MVRRRKYRRKRRGKGLLGADCPKISKTLRPYLQKRKQKGGTWWALKKTGLW